MSHSQGLKGQDSSLSHNEQKGFMLSCVCPIVNQEKMSKYGKNNRVAYEVQPRVSMIF